MTAGLTIAPHCRVIVDNDYQGDPDSLVAFYSPARLVRIAGVWPLGDSPTVLVTALSTESSRATVSPAEPGRGVRQVYTDPDFRLIVGDMLDRFRLHEHQKHSQEPGQA